MEGSPLADEVASLLATEGPMLYEAIARRIGCDRLEVVRACRGDSRFVLVAPGTYGLRGQDR